MATGKGERRQRAAQNALATLAHIPLADLLPMPVKAGSTKVSLEELAEYRERVRRHAEHFPDYERGWCRPLPATANAVWALVCPGLRDTPVHRLALVVALDRALAAARRGKSLTFNHVYDSVARCWSPTFRTCVEAGRANTSYEMTEETLKAAYRDLLREEVDLGGVWNAVVNGRNPLYRPTRIPRGAFQIELRSDAALDQFERFIAADPSFRRHDLPVRLLLRDQPTPAYMADHRIVAERAFSEIVDGERARKAIELQQSVELEFDAPLFLEEYREWERQAAAVREYVLAHFDVDPAWSRARPERIVTGKDGKMRRVRSARTTKIMKAIPSTERRQSLRPHLRAYDKLVARLQSYRGVYDQLAGMGLGPNTLRATWPENTTVTIKTSVYRLRNRRYQPAHFWPSMVRARADDPAPEALRGKGPWTRDGTERYRWFQLVGVRTYSDPEEPIGPHAGVDVSSSQTQITAVLIGARELEARAGGAVPFKEYLASLAWDRRDGIGMPEGYRGPDDPRLVRFAKQAWMTTVYGSNSRNVVWTLGLEPEKYGPRWTPEAVRGLLTGVPGFFELERFLQACRRIGATADRYRGVTFPDPLDPAVEVRWNPPQCATRPVPVGKQTLYVTAPGQYKRVASGRVWVPAKPNSEGEYPVNRAKLGRLVAPSLIHVLDAFFATLVIEGLAERGVDTFVSIHDCWLVAHDDLPRLQESVQAANESWLLGLGPIYDRLVKLLGNDKEYGPDVTAWRAQWETRKAARDWPAFRVAPSDLAG